MKIVLLGTGTPGPNPRCSGPSTAVVIGRTVLVVDAGPGVCRRATAAGIGMNMLTRLFLTHLHSDHTTGLADFMLTPAVTGRQEPCHIYGPPGTAHMVEKLQEAYSLDKEVRLEGLEDGCAEAYEFVAHDDFAVTRLGQTDVLAFPVDHGSWKHAYGYVFEADGQKVVISGDTRPCDSLLHHAAGCDILLHEVFCERAVAAWPEEKQAYHRAFHTSAVDLGKIAAEVKPGVLVLHHQLLFGASPMEVFDEIRENYSGPLVYGHDLNVVGCDPAEDSEDVHRSEQSLIDKHWPPRGGCTFCKNPDAWHRVFNTILTRFEAGSRPKRLAHDYCKPVEAIEALVREGKALRGRDSKKT